MKTKVNGHSQHRSKKVIPAEDDFHEMDAWARNLKLGDGRPLSKLQAREERLARSVGRPPKADAAKARRIMISMTPALAEAAGNYAKKSGHTLSGLIAESLMERIKRKAS